MNHHLHLQNFILGQLDLFNGANLWRAAGDAEKQFRGAVSPAVRNEKCFSTYFISVLEEARSSCSLSGLPRFWKRWVRGGLNPHGPEPLTH
jgi:hypothetical protein